jgi:hypothetical protein
MITLSSKSLITQRYIFMVLMMTFLLNLGVVDLVVMMLMKN